MSCPRFHKLLFVSAVLLFIPSVACENSEGVAGEFFGVPVPIGNYRFAASVVSRFNTSWGGIPRTTEEFEKRVWDELILSYEAFRRNIEPNRQEIEAEITKIIEGGETSFNWRENRGAYRKWVSETLGVPVETFENQMAHLVTIHKLRQQVLESIEPDVTEGEALQLFLDEHNTLSIELVQFDKLEDAEEFYQEAKSEPGHWEEKKKREEESEEDSSFKRPGFVALSFLMHMWQLPREAVYDMIKMNIGAIHPPAPIYRGYGVFKILNIRRAEKERFAERRESYYEKIRMRKKLEGFKNRLEELREEANIKKYEL